MDFRHLRLTPEQADVAASVLNYQPFIISDDVQTGAAYSWYYTKDPRISPPLVFRRSEWEPEWDRIKAINGRQRIMYDDFIRYIAERYKGRTLLDVACNNGYFPVRAEMFGMGPSFGMDAANYDLSVQVLNRFCGTHATFRHIAYNPTTHTAPVEGRYDVVVANTIMWHLPDPTYFLAFLGRLAREAIFMWVHILDTDERLVSYGMPHAQLGSPTGHVTYPHAFNDFTQVSRGLLELAFRSMGFPNITYLPWSETWLPFAAPHDKAPGLESLSEEDRFGRSVLPAIRKGDRQVAVFATR
jgi:hypothetical protein